MSKRSPTLAQVWASELQYGRDGERGDFYRAGNPVVETSAGQKQWDFKYLGTTEELSKAGGLEKVGTTKPTTYSNEFTKCWLKTTLYAQHDTFTLTTTRRMAHQEEYSLQQTSFSPQSPSPKRSAHLWSTSTLPSNPVSDLAKLLLHPSRSAYLTTSEPGDKGPMHKRTNTQTRYPKTPRLLEKMEQPTLSDSDDDFPPPADNTNPLKLDSSPLRPHCKANQRIEHWKPLNARNALDADGLPTNLNQGDLARIRKVLQEAYAQSTKATYGTGLYIFHAFCDKKSIEEKHRAPVQPAVLASFISNLAGTYGGGTIKNYVYGVRAWHILHGMAWSVNEDELVALLTAGGRLAPKKSRRRERAPWTLSHLKKICHTLDRKNNLDAAVLACLTTAFWGTARLGEVTVPNLEAFDPSVHVKVADVEHDVVDRNNLKETVIFLPWTKTSKEKGENIFWAKQRGPVDPRAALANHLKLNKPPPNAHLFSYQHKNGWRPMTRSTFLKRITHIAKEAGFPKLQGHGIRIGSTLEYLLRGVPFDVVKVKGRWKSDAFRGYLRDHARIMAPYMQDNTSTDNSFIRYTMPPVR